MFLKIRIMNIKSFLCLLHKRTFGLAILSFFIFSTTYSQQVVLNVLDRTKGEASLYFYQPPRTDNYTFTPLPVINKHIGQKTTLTDTTFQVSFIPNRKVFLMLYLKEKTKSTTARTHLGKSMKLIEVCFQRLIQQLIYVSVFKL